ncbi:MAG: DNA adenine methylase [Cyanobacteria bacterium HKST-UBA02]|nr:DNA adenine methylase [Cyanobacteria bacterium HKST-UBA02]
MASLVRLRSPLRYPGGKQKAVPVIASMLPGGRVAEYREPMLGGGSVYFHVRERDFASTYWLNDLFTELVSFYSCVRDEELCKRLVGDLTELRESLESPEQAREFFLAARQEKPDDPYRQAFLFFFFNRVTFSGTTRAGGFSKAAAAKRFTQSAINRLEIMPGALKGVRLTNMNVFDVVSAPGKDVFIFLDPPYYQASRLYGRDGSLHSFDHEELASRLSRSDHRFLITYDDCPEIRSLYKWARIEPFKLQYGMNNCNRERTSKIGEEIFIANYS